MRRLPADDGGLWRRAMRDVAPLPGRAAPPEPHPDRGRLARPQALPLAGEGDEGAAARAPAPVRHQPPAPLDRFAGIDRASAERLKRGRYTIEATIDLHGMTQAEAHRALSRFVAGSRAAGRRCVLVVTGQGRIGGGVLKSAVPRWLGEPDLRHHLLAIAPAQPKDGGAGALYVRLRRLPQTG